MANLPEQLQRQVDEADAVLAQMQTPETPPVDDTVTSVQVVEVPSNVTSVQPTVLPNDPNSDTYEQRWKSLQGIFNATVRQKDALTGRVAQLEQMLSTLHQPAQQQVQQSNGTRYLTEKDVTDYGDSIDVMRRVVREELAPVISQFQGSIQSLGQNVSNQVQHVAQRQALTQDELFYQKLNQEVPDWMKINDNPLFQQWLSEVDQQTGIQKQIYLQDAHRNLDVKRVAYFFHKWASEQQPVTPATEPQTVTRTPASQLELQVSPGKTRVTNSPVVNGQPKTWLRSDISRFYDAVRKGAYRGKEAEMGQIEQDIIAASRENRVVAG